MGRKVEGAKRDLALARIEEARPHIVGTALRVAQAIAKRNGTVTSTEVLRALRQNPATASMIQDADPRFMGAVFRRDCWVADGWDDSGSHRRPVRIWRLADGFDMSSLDTKPPPPPPPPPPPAP
jgi:hypothetical protein